MGLLDRLFIIAERLAPSTAHDPEVETPYFHVYAPGHIRVFAQGAEVTRLVFGYPPPRFLSTLINRRVAIDEIRLFNELSQQIGGVKYRPPLYFFEGDVFNINLNIVGALE